MLNIGWFSTAKGDSSKKLLDTVISHIHAGNLNVKIDFIFCNREHSESEKTDAFIQQVKDYQIPLVCFSVKKFALNFQQKVGVKDDNLPEWRLEYDRQIMSRLQGYEVDICMLAGYMLIMGPEMCSRYNMINLHPALPMGPKGTWQEVIWELIKEKATESGVMIHLVTTDMDRGPVISFCRYPINGQEFDNLWDEFKNTSISVVKSQQGDNNGLFKSIRQSGFIRETPLIVHTLKSFSDRKIRINNDKKLVNNSGAIIAGYDLTEVIDMEIKKGLK